MIQPFSTCRRDSSFEMLQFPFPRSKTLTIKPLHFNITTWIQAIWLDMWCFRNVKWFTPSRIAMKFNAKFLCISLEFCVLHIHTQRGFIECCVEPICLNCMLYGSINRPLTEDSHHTWNQMFQSKIVQNKATTSNWIKATAIVEY